MKTTRKNIRFELNDPSKLYEGGLSMLMSCLDSFASSLTWIIWKIDIIADLTSLGTNVSEMRSESDKFPPSRLFSWSEINEIVRNIIDVEEFIVAGFHQQIIHTNVNDFSNLLNSAPMVISIEDSTYLDFFGVDGDMMKCLLANAKISGLKKVKFTTQLDR